MFDEAGAPSRDSRRSRTPPPSARLAGPGHTAVPHRPPRRVRGRRPSPVCADRRSLALGIVAEARQVRVQQRERLVREQDIRAAAKHLDCVARRTGVDEGLKGVGDDCPVERSHGHRLRLGAPRLILNASSCGWCLLMATSGDFHIAIENERSHASPTYGTCASERFGKTHARESGGGFEAATAAKPHCCCAPTSTRGVRWTCRSRCRSGPYDAQIVPRLLGDRTMIRRRSCSRSAPHAQMSSGRRCTSAVAPERVP